MKKFHFSLNTALEWRETKADQEKQKLEALFTQQKQLHAEAAELNNEMRAASDLLAMAGALDAAELSQFSHFRAAINARQERLAAAERKTQSAIATQQQKFVEADRERQLMAKLKHKQHKAWKHELNRELDAAASESFLAGWVRNS